MCKISLGETTAGHVVNLLSNDVSRFDIALMSLHFLWIGPLQTAVVTYFLWQELGFSSLLGIATFLLLIPVQGSNIYVYFFYYYHCRTIAVPVYWSARMVFETVFFSRLVGQENVRLSCEDSAQDRRENKIDERDHFRHTSDQNVHLGKAICIYSAIRKEVSAQRLRKRPKAPIYQQSKSRGGDDHRPTQNRSFRAIYKK